MPTFQAEPLTRFAQNLFMAAGVPNEESLIVAGSLVWWVFLSAMVGRIRHRVTEAGLRKINYGAGLLLVLFGAMLVGELALKTIYRAGRAIWLG